METYLGSVEEHIDKSTVSRVILAFCNVLIKRSQEFIKFPFADEEKAIANKTSFFFKLKHSTQMSKII